ncbi:MAG: cupredoxin domain-containing protein [Acidimicrobiales bacterium]|nr:cupredoxin domain-containing protein [Acidimicrobiales bacterium]
MTDMLASMRRALLLLLIASLVAAACGDTPTPETAADPTTSRPPTIDEGATATGLGEPESDAAWPIGTPATPTGAVGFSRYVYARMGDAILPFLLEGPAQRQVRCQDVDEPCSYLDLKALLESGDEVPSRLAMTRDELADLVAELDELSETLTALDSIDAACAAGYEPYTTQWPNMGIHLRNAEHSTDGVLIPSRPDVVMFAREGGENTPLADLGDCEDGHWTGDSTGYEVVGSAFYLPLTADHPDGFTGPIDNWHMHFNSCGGSELSGTTPVSREECEADGGTFFTVDPQWMIHAYAVPDYDNQSGVFSMWNPSVSPVAEPADVEFDRTQPAVDGAVTWSINNFALGDLQAEVGQPVVFTNSDDAPHTITSTEGLFDSDTFGSGGSFQISFDEPGAYSFFCEVHPSMTGSVVVG